MKSQKTSYLVISIIVLLGLTVFGFRSYYLRKQNEQKPIPSTPNWTVYVNKTYGYSFKFPASYEVQPGNEEQNTCLRVQSGDGRCVVLINVYDNNKNLTLIDYLKENSTSFGVTGPLIDYDFNGYKSLFNKNQPGTNLFMGRGVNVYRIIASEASSNKEVGDIVATFRFM